jgi:L-iditol 2-dehydrogenase
MYFWIATPKDKLCYDASKIFIREISIVPSYSTSELEINTALKLMLSKRIDVAQLITHRFRLGQVKKAFDLDAQKKDSLKTVVLS